MNFRTSLGLMSGTSMDGIDAAVVTTDGEDLKASGPTYYRPYGESERALLKKALETAQGLKKRTERPGDLAAAERIVTDAHIEAIESLLALARSQNMVVDLVGFHGQTVLHRPSARLTVQIGNAQKIAERFSLPVVADMRAADVAAGGQGAPLVPIMHATLVRKAALPLPVAVVNIGGVANITLVGEDDSLLAFDAGPGNALLNDWVQARAGLAMDENGELAAAGKIHEDILTYLLGDPYFKLSPPKSLDRDYFRSRALAEIARLNIEDGAATLTAFTARAISLGLRQARGRLNKIIVAGGGAHNPVMLAHLQDYSGTPVLTADSLGWNGDFLEAQAFAFLAVRSLRGLPLTYPGTTGVKKPMTGGVLFQPHPG